MGGEGAPSRRSSDLEVTAAVSAHQRRWFDEVRARASDGEPVALLSADAPHELYRALDIPYVVVQWWSSLVAAKQQAPRALAALRRAGYPDDVEQYNSLGFGLLLAEGADGAPGGGAAGGGGPGESDAGGGAPGGGGPGESDALGAEGALRPPWGGLPRPAVVQCALAGDGMRKLFECWAQRAGARDLSIERTVESCPDPPGQWWDALAHDWDRVLEPARLDLLAAELGETVRQLEQLCGRRLDPDRLDEVLELANEQAEWNRRTRDLIAASEPVPVRAGETMAATMIPQWHRGSSFGRDAARALHDEVAARVGRGGAACPGERIRLMWLGRGLWSNLGIYEQFEKSDHAVFVWSMYLALAADGYLRYVDGRDPMRALAARFVPMGDELRTPSWSGPWHRKEALLHRVDGVVSLGEDDHFSARLLEEEQIPLLSIDADNVDTRTWSAGALGEALGRFVRGPAAAHAERRHS